MLSRPGIQCRPGEFRTVIQDERFWQRAREKQPIQNPAHPRSTNGSIGLNHRGFFGTGIRHRQTFEPPTRHQLVMHKIHRVTESWPCWSREGTARHHGRLSPSSPTKGEVLLSIIEALHLFMVDRPAFPSQPDINPRTAIAALTLSHLADSYPQGRIARAAVTIPERVPIKRHEAAHSSLTEPKARRDPLSRGSLRLGRYQLFAVTALSAWMSRACSAIICFSRRFSSSSWRSFFTSLTSSPAYFVRHL